MNDACVAARQPIASELLIKFNGLADRAHTLAQRAVGTLDPIMRQVELCNEPGCENVEEQYPPLFAEYRNALEQIQNSLSTIDDCLERAEI